MKSIFLVLAFALASNIAGAQADSTKPLFERYPLPQFSILLPDSASYFSKSNLPKNKYTILILFSPDCEHCQHETELILKNINSFEKAHFVMTTTLPFEKMKEFYDKYKLKDYPSITMGRDTRHFFGGYFSPAIHSVPFIAIYDENYVLRKVFDGAQKMEVLLAELK